MIIRQNAKYLVLKPVKNGVIVVEDRDLARNIDGDTYCFTSSADLINHIIQNFLPPDETVLFKET